MRRGNWGAVTTVQVLCLPFGLCSELTHNKLMLPLSRFVAEASETERSCLPQSHTAGKWQSWDVKEGLPGPKSCASVIPEGWRQTPCEGDRDDTPVALGTPEAGGPVLTLQQITAILSVTQPEKAGGWEEEV